MGKEERKEGERGRVEGVEDLRKISKCTVTW